MMRPLGSFTVPHGHPCLPGHFPGHPLVPGVVLLDGAARLILGAEPGRVLSGFPAVRFSHPVLPGQEVSVFYEAGRFALHAEGRAVLSGAVSLA